MKACQHGLVFNKACPWCNRKGGVEGIVNNLATPKKVFQLYQMHFETFMRQVRGEDLSGPLTCVFAVHDMNGNVYYNALGTVPESVNLIDYVANALLEGQHAKNPN